jgi:hypothetical protein
VHIDRLITVPNQTKAQNKAGELCLFLLWGINSTKSPKQIDLWDNKKPRRSGVKVDGDSVRDPRNDRLLKNHSAGSWWKLKGPGLPRYHVTALGY